MSIVAAPATREPVELHERKPLTPAQKVALLDRQSDLCGCGCGERLVRDDGICEPMIDEHVVPLWCGGTNELTNRALYLVACARKKTVREATERGHVLRLERDHDPATRRKSPHRLRGRKFRRADDLKESAR